MPRWRVWKPEEIALLGTMSDQKLAEKLGIDNNSVYRARQKRGIPSFQLQKPWTEQEIAMLGRFSDGQIARMTQRGKQAVTFKRRSMGIAPINK